MLIKCIQKSYDVHNMGNPNWVIMAYQDYIIAKVLWEMLSQENE